MVSGPSASPLATGGAGTIFEYRVAALALAALLRGDRVEGFAVPMVEVGLQQRIAGNYLDDIVVYGEGGDGLPVQIEFQVKRTVAPVPSDAQWRSVVGQCVSALEADVDGVAERRHLFGLAAAGPKNRLAELAELTKWARVQATAAAFDSVISAERASSAPVRQRWRALRESVEQVLAERGSTPGSEGVDDVAFRIASALRVWVVQVDDAETDYRHAVDRLSDLLEPDQRSVAATLFVNLADIAQELGSRAGRIDRPWLRA